MSNTVETFILGSGGIPDWVKSYMSNGVIQKIENEDGVFYRINSPTGMKKASVGDVVVRTRSGVNLVPADKAEKYKMVANVPHIDVKVDEAKDDEE